MKIGLFNYCIVGLVAGKASVARNPEQLNRLPSFLKVGHLVQNLNDDGIVR
jgi:hypothetical protein